MFTFLLISLVVIYALFGLGVLSMARAASLSDEAMDAQSARQRLRSARRTMSRHMHA